MPLPGFIIIGAPVFIVILLVSIRHIYGDEIFNYDRRELNNPDDPRILRLNLTEPAKTLPAELGNPPTRP